MFDVGRIFRPKSIEQALELMETHPEAVVIAGGSDVLIKIREGRLAGRELISIFELDELRGISLDDRQRIHIKPLTSFSDISAHPIVRELIPVLADAAETVGGPQIRNIGTVGGNICNGVTSADTASTLLVYDAILTIRGTRGMRRVPLTGFYKGAGKVGLSTGELLVDIEIEHENYRGFYGGYFKYATRNALDIATVGCAALVRLSADKSIIEEFKLAFGVLSPVPCRCPSAERAGSGERVCRRTIEAAADATLLDISPRTSWRATRELRMHLARELTVRMMESAIMSAGGYVRD